MHAYRSHTCADLNRSHVGQEVRLAGWVHRVRELGKISFLLLRDRSGMAQCVVDGKAEVTPESVVIIRGRVAANDKAPGGGSHPGPLCFYCGLTVKSRRSSRSSTRAFRASAAKAAC